MALKALLGLCSGETKENYGNIQPTYLVFRSSLEEDIFQI